MAYIKRMRATFKVSAMPDWLSVSFSKQDKHHVLYRIHKRSNKNDKY